MCTLTINFHPGDDYPLIIAANRDEFYSRPSSPPAIIENDPIIFAPQDLEAGGTWFGINEFGLIAMITNVWIQFNGLRTQGEPSTRSRGQLTLDVLRCSSLIEAKKLVRQLLHKDHYQYFNLVVLSPKEGTIFSYTGKLKEFPLTQKGATILNAPYDPSIQKTDRLPIFKPKMNRSEKTVHSWLSSLQHYLSRHPDYCKHNRLHGTRSSQILIFSKRVGTLNYPLFLDRFWYADGPPCCTSFDELSTQLQSIFQQIATKIDSTP